ncbi:Gfo/Idh/MocA family protein [Trujillonella humicola]|uniref:Gfo/Idh/MocA family protein n=1 Tax=Trujillonella humicola TaxID=3383699 RepID=UPI0039067FDA
MGDQRRSGLVGSGMIAEVHARAVRSTGAVVSAVVDTSLDAAEAGALRFGAERALTSLDDLLALDEIDVVHICTPNHLHAPMAQQVLAAGKHVICEKPLATSEADARVLRDAADAAGVVHAVPFVYRFYPTVRDARGRVRSGAAGDIRLVHGSYLQDWLASAEDDNWRVDARLGGASRAFADIGVHWCDLVEFTTGHRIQRLTARMLTVHPTRNGRAGATAVATEDAVGVLFETDRGALGTLVISQVTHGRKNRLWFSIDGDASSMSFDQELPDSLWVGARDFNKVVMRGAPDSDPSAARYNVLPAGHPQGYQDSFTAFVRDVYARIDGEDVDGLPTFADGLRAAVITDAVLESAGSGSWVEVPS